MRKIKIGSRKKNVKYDFRETCFGIVYQEGLFYVTEKDEEVSFIGGGVEENETHEDTLKREFLEEAGLTVLRSIPFVTVDCFWYTRDERNMESLANFYLVEVDKKIKKPTEKCSKLVKLTEQELKKRLALPYQKKAMEMFQTLRIPTYEKRS